MSAAIAKAFEDTSLFQSQIEWVDDVGQKWRAEHNIALWKVFKVCAGVDLFFRTVAGPGSLSPRQVHAKAQR
jgi:hypothetical protein